MGKTAQGAVWLTADRLSPVRLLAVLAQHRGRRRRPLPAPVHRSAAGRDRPAGSAGRRRDQRGQEDPGHRGHRPGPRPADADAGRRNRAAARSRKARRPRRCPRITVPAARTGGRHPGRSACSRMAGLAASNGEARRLIRGGGARVNDAAVTEEGADDHRGRCCATARSNCRPGASSTGWSACNSTQCRQNNAARNNSRGGECGGNLPG